MTSRRIRLLVPAVLILSLTAASLAFGASRDNNKKHDQNTFGAILRGHDETPAVHTTGNGTLSLTINADKTMSFVLTYSGLLNPATASHVHFGQPNVAGGVSFFLCGGTKPACPAGNSTTPVTVTGTIAAADVLAIPAQGLAAADLGAIEEEIAAGFAYVNIHTAISPGGEIRGQLGGNNGHDDGDEGHSSRHK